MVAVKIVCMGYVKENGEDVFICPVDLGEKMMEKPGVTHGCCDSCTAKTLEIMRSQIAATSK